MRDKKNQKLLENLKKSYDDGKLSHAFIFESQDITSALEFSKELVMHIFSISDKTELENIPDFKIYDKENSKMENIRQLISGITVIPYKPKRIYIFTDGDNLSIPVQNAMLKTLEEPPSHAIFIIITSNSHLLLETVRSRANIFLLGKEDSGEEFEDNDIIKSTEEFIIAPSPLKYVDLKTALIEKKDSIKLILINLLKELKSSLKVKNGVSLDKKDMSILSQKIGNNLRNDEIISIVNNIDDKYKKLNANCNITACIELMLIEIMEARN